MSAHSLITFLANFPKILTGFFFSKTKKNKTKQTTTTIKTNNKTKQNHSNSSELVIRKYTFLSSGGALMPKIPVTFFSNSAFSGIARQLKRTLNFHPFSSFPREKDQCAAHLCLRRGRAACRHRVFTGPAPPHPSGLILPLCPVPGWAG